eukprot:GFKZ01003335.1.p1 GENE.GFKZ01003335.1~~GFKZ01003335.1.p1  ORF type:complete len:1006 (-),score=232.64 GFKZ01003335.1:667-3684(-)
MALDSDSDMETVELSDVDAEVTADAVADQVMGDADADPKTGRPEDDFPSPPPSPDQSRRHSMAARMAANRETRLRRSREDVNSARKREEQHQKEDLERRRALEASAKRYQTSLKSGKRKSTVPVKRNTEVIDDSDEDLPTQSEKSRKLPPENPVRQSPMRKAKVKANETGASRQQKDVVMPDYTEQKPSPVKKPKKKVTRKKKVLQTQDGDEASAPAEEPTSRKRPSKASASEKRPPSGKKANSNKPALEANDDASTPEEDHSSDDTPLSRGTRLDPGSMITTPVNTRPLGSPKSKGKLSGAARAARESRLKRDGEENNVVQVVDGSPNGAQDILPTQKQDGIEDKREAPIEEAEKLRKEQAQWRKKTKEDLKKKGDEKRKREGGNARKRASTNRTNLRDTHTEEEDDDEIHEDDSADDVTDDDDDDVILVTTFPNSKPPATKGYIPVSEASKDEGNEGSRKKRGRPRKTLTDPEEAPKRRKVGTNDGAKKSKSAAASGKSARGKKASTASQNESTKLTPPTSQMEVDPKASSPPMIAEHDGEVKEVGKVIELVDSPRRTTLRSTKGGRKPANAQSDGSLKKTRGGSASAAGRSTEASAKALDQAQGERNTAPDEKIEAGGGNQAGAPRAAGVDGATPATAQRARSKAKKVSKPVSKSTPGGSKAGAAKSNETNENGERPEAASLPADGAKPEMGLTAGQAKLPPIYVSEREEASVIQQLVYSLETLDLQHVDLQEDLFAKVLGKLAQRSDVARSTSLMEVEGDGLSHGVRQTRRRRELMRNIEAAKVEFQGAQQKALVSFVQAVSASLQMAREKGGGALGDMIRSKGDGGHESIFGVGSDVQFGGVNSTGVKESKNGGVEEGAFTKSGKAAADDRTASGKAKASAKGSSRQGRTRSGIAEGGRSAAANAAAPLPHLKTMAEVKSFVRDKYSSLNLNCMRSQAILTLCERDGGVGRTELCEALPFSARIFDARISELKKLGFINEWRTGEGTEGSVMYSTVTIAD